MIAFLCNGCQGFTKKAVIKVAHDNGVNILIVGSGDLVVSEDDPEDSFAELLLRLSTGIRDQGISFACGVHICLLSNHVYLRCHTYEKRILDFGYRPQ